MSSHRMFSVAGDAAIQLLQLISASAEVFPPLKGAAEGALHIAGIVKRFRSNKDQWQDFGTFVQDATASVLESFARPDSPEDTKFNLVKLQNVLEDSAKRISSEQALPRHRRLAKFLHDPDMIADMKARIEDAIKLFQLNTAIATVIDVRKTFDAVVTNGKTLSEIKQDTSTIIKTTASLSLSANLEKLRRVQGASWDIYRICLANTRTTIIEDILSWVHNTSETSGAKILLLTAVAGAGKTTIAHTVAQKCADRKLLGSSFFFDRETEGRNSPTALFSTIAADLSRLDKRLAERISQAIEDDKSLPSAPLSRQFEELVLKPSQEVPPIGPLVVVIDALDEAWDKDLLVILRDYAPRLPNTFRIFLTSRMRPELDGLPRKPHVHWIDLDIGSQTNIQDISVFVPYKLQQLAEERDLGEGWPGEQLRTKFHSRAGGLFLWVAIVCDYLRDRDDPTRELDELLSAVDVPMGSAEAQMDRLYATILLGFDWSDASFVTGYRRVIGTAIATKTPLTISEMKELFQDQPLASDYALQRLSPLLTGMSKAVHNTQPVRVLHQSLRDFLVVRAANSSDYAQFRIIEQEHSQLLALLCLQTLNRSLNNDIANVGYLAKSSDNVRGIPSTNSDRISKILWYACQFWFDHLLDVHTLEIVEEPLQKFLTKKLVLWMEVLAICGLCRALGDVWEWIQESPSSQTILQAGDYKNYADACMSLGNRLEYEDRREEAVEATRAALVLCRKLAETDSALFAPEISLSLDLLFSRLADLGRFEEALPVVQESVNCYRQLSATQPATFIHSQALALNNLSSCLARLGRREEALLIAREAADLYRQITAKHPNEVTPDLAMSFNNLSSRLADLGCREEALEVMQEAVKQYQQLSALDTVAFSSGLAMSLCNLSLRYNKLGRTEDALLAVQDSARIYRHLAADRPAGFSSLLAHVLQNLAFYLSELDRQEEALLAIREVVELERKLTADHPFANKPKLAQALNNMSNYLSKLGLQHEALPIFQETVQLHRELVEYRPAAFTQGFAMCLNNLVLCLLDLGQYEDALPVALEATERRRRLHADDPAIFTPDLAASLHSLSDCLSGVGRAQDALLAITEAVDLRRQLAATKPAMHAPRLAMSLNLLSDRLYDLGRYDDAVLAIQEATKLYWQLAIGRPVTIIPELARSLRNLSACLSKLGRHEEALVAGNEATELQTRSVSWA